MHLKLFRAGSFLFLTACWFPHTVRAYTCTLDAYSNGTVANSTVFPNWKLLKTGSFDVVLCSGCPGVTEIIQALTVVNFGTGTSADISGVYWQARCGATVSPLYTLTYAGVFMEDLGSHPAWTWGGATPDLAACAALCGTCAGQFTIDLFADIGPCPTELATVELGFPIHAASNPVWWGSISDNNGCVVPWYDMSGAVQTILHVLKEADRDAAAPGDTVTYTVTYGRPGTAALSSITVMDTQPPWMHYVAGSAVPAPDPLWDPDWGPPVRLKWTIPGPLAVTGGPTGQVTFKLTVDWGNTESFEPGSGDVAAPEGARLDNRAQVTWNGLVGCATDSWITQPVTTVVRRFLFWTIGDNDLLFAPSLGQPPDEMIYSVYLQNLSPQKTWWKVSVWDTVPPELDPWCSGCGFDDPCLGWTMTPSGCAAATPGRLVSGGQTLLTWRLDMPPNMTLSLRWKSQIRSGITAGATAVNKVSVLELGQSSIVAGTGHSGGPRNFAHLAPVVLQTTFVSYVGYAASCVHNVFVNNKGIPQPGGCPGFFLDFFALNKKTQFELRALEYEAQPFALVGGISGSIGCLIGDCLGGFPGNAGSCPVGGVPGGGIAGCKIERIPAVYDPTGWKSVCMAFPSHFIYKLTSNAPVLWQLLTHISQLNDDNHTPAPSSSLSYVGLMHYAWRRDDPFDGAGFGDSFSLINTSLDAWGVASPGLQTTVHLFKFNYASLQWDYVKTYDLDQESQAYVLGTSPAENGAWRTMSSDARLIVDHGFNLGDPICAPTYYCGNNFATYMPARETGNVVKDAPAHFYGLVAASDWLVKVAVGNLGAATASYQVWRYVPANTLPPAGMPSQLNGTGGSWVATTGVLAVPPGLAAPGNPDIYSTLGAAFNAKSVALYKVELSAGGPVQIMHGGVVYTSNSSGSVMHALDGQQTGTEFWLHQGNAWVDTGCTRSNIQTIASFAPRTGMGIRLVSEDGYSASYTSTGPDQCISFIAITETAVSGKRNYRLTVLPGPAFGRVITQHIDSLTTQKGYTAPFLATGTHYLIVAPPVAFVGQSFWITVAVYDSTGTTKVDYCGTSSFTSTDPGAQLEGTAMDAYNFTWSSSIACPAAPDENGVRMFVNVTLTRLGLQTIVGTDTVDGSITGLTAVVVVGTDVKLTKEPRLAVGASGDTVSFRVCWSNYSSASAFTFVITDAVPMGTTFLPEAGTAAFDCGSTDGVSIIPAYSTATSVTPPAAFTTANPLAGTRWLRWTIPMAGVATTGCACYRVTVN